MRRSALCVLLACIAFAIAACAAEDRPTCYAGDYLGCTCANGAAGYQACSANQNGYDACVCDGKTPGSGTKPVGAKGYLEGCSADSDCASSICGIFPSKGNRCTTSCKVDSDCAVPSPGCNPQKICKAP